MRVIWKFKVTVRAYSDNKSDVLAQIKDEQKSESDGSDKMERRVMVKIKMKVGVMGENGC